MFIERIQVQNVRNLSNIVIEPNPFINIFVGPNASGKTAFLEAIYILSRGKSFRTARLSEVVQHEQSSLLINATLRKQNGNYVNTGLEKAKAKKTIHYNNSIVRKVSEQAKNIPLLLVAPDSHRLIAGDPKQRRHWLDWAMFHVKPDYLDIWKDYHRSLRHRNALLKKLRPEEDQLSGWEKAMADAAEKINMSRIDYLAKMQILMEVMLKDGDISNNKICYRGGWKKGTALIDCLKMERETDSQFGYTRSGIHRADIDFLTEEKLISSVCSRGQTKHYIACLVLAQLQLLESETGQKPLFLIDDFSAEIDSKTRAVLVDRLLDLGVQVFITTTELDPTLIDSKKHTAFHVERGKYLKVIE